MKKKILTTVLIVITVALVIIGLVLTQLDKIMMSVSPELYVSYRAINTINEINKEKDMINAAFPRLRKLSDSHNADINFNSENVSLTVNEDYNNEIPSIVFSGSYNDTEYEGYINNTETAVAVPSIADLYFIFSSKNFGSELNQSSASAALPLEIPKGLNIILPEKDSNEDDIISGSKLLNISKLLIKDVKIKHDSDDDYYMILKAQSIKEAFDVLFDTLKNSEALKLKTAFFEKTYGISTDDTLDMLAVLFEDIESDVTVKYTETKNYVTRLETTLTNNDYNFHLLWECKNKVRLLEDYTVSVMAESGGSQIGIEYNENGNKFFEDEEKVDNRSVRVVFGNEDILNCALNMNYDISGRELLGKASINSIKADISGAINDSGTKINITGITSDEKAIGECVINITDMKNKQPSEKKKYPFKDLKIEDILSAMR